MTNPTELSTAQYLALKQAVEAEFRAEYRRAIIKTKPWREHNPSQAFKALERAVETAICARWAEHAGNPMGDLVRAILGARRAPDQLDLMDAAAEGMLREVS